MSSNERIYVIGHRNPDTDSICSALAYAQLRRRQGLAGVRAARAGNINQQSQFVLDYLGVDQPELLVDVYPRVSDVVTEKVVTIHRCAPLSKAIELYHQHHIRLLPVVDDKDFPQGLLLLKSATEALLVPKAPEQMRRIRTSLSAIRSSLDAKSCHVVDPDPIEDYNLYVAARREETFSRWLSQTDVRKNILIIGDRPSVQRMAIEAGVRLMIVAGDSPVDDELLDLARANDVSVLISRYDTANSVWLTRMAIPVGELAETDFICVKPGELLEDLRIKLTHGTHAGAIVTAADGTVAGIATKSHLIRNAHIKLILVDHNELIQAVPGAEKVEILEVVDHHRLGNFHTDLPIRFINQPVGSTCSLVATLYQQAGIDPDAITAGLLLAGLLSDTVILKSPTCTEFDRKLVPWLEQLSGLSYEEFGEHLFAAGSPMASGAPARDLIFTDFKEYQMGEQCLGLGQVEVVSLHSFHSRRSELQEELIKIREEKGYELAALLVTDIVMETSVLLVAGSAELPYIIGYPQEDESLYRLDGVLSRKKQLVPHLMKAFKAL
jgi:manganese-dependent inorganic pyrophosphatase